MDDLSRQIVHLFAQGRTGIIAIAGAIPGLRGSRTAKLRLHPLVFAGQRRQPGFEPLSVAFELGERLVDVLVPGAGTVLRTNQASSRGASRSLALHPFAKP